MTPRQFWTACRIHDWTYMYSDDPGVYRNGKEQNEALLNEAHADPALMDIYRAWGEYHFENGAKPAEPKLED